MFTISVGFVINGLVRKDFFSSRLISESELFSASFLVPEELSSCVASFRMNRSPFDRFEGIIL